MKIRKLLPVVALLASCASPPSPSCGNVDVHETVHRLAAQWLQQNWHSIGRAYEEFFVVPFALDGIGSWDGLRQYSESQPTAKRIVAVVEGLSASMQPLDNVRTTGTNDELRWRSCAATLPMAFDAVEFRFPIEYAVQYTEDGKIYVELSVVL